MFCLLRGEHIVGHSLRGPGRQFGIISTRKDIRRSQDLDILLHQCAGALMQAVVVAYRRGVEIGPTEEKILSVVVSLRLSIRNLVLQRRVLSLMKYNKVLSLTSSLFFFAFNAAFFLLIDC